MSDERSDLSGFRSEQFSRECIICGDSSEPLTSIKDKSSWLTLYKAAVIRKFSRILKWEESDFPIIFYHRNCRSRFTLKKDLEKIVSRDTLNNLDTSAKNSNNISSLRKQNLREKTANSSSDASSTVYEKKCIFCSKVDKYQKGQKTRELLRQALELRVDDTLRKIAIEKEDSKMLAFTSRDIVAAEAQYHASCYKNYTRSRPIKEKIPESAYSIAEKNARLNLFCYIRTEVFSSPDVIPLVMLQEKNLHLMNDAGFTEIVDSTKKNLKHHLQQEFGESLRFFTIRGKVYVVPDNLNFESLLNQYINIQSELKLHKSKNEEDQAILVAKNLRNEIQNIDTSHQTWPPSLRQADIVAPQQLTKFLKVLLGNEKFIWSVSQDIIQAVIPRKVLLKKHILLSTVVKTLTGNVELIRILNRLGHACNYSKLLEIETAFALQKIEYVTDGDDEIPLPAFVQPSVPTVLAYDNIDRLEETLSGSGTSHRINGIIIQSEVSSCIPPPSSSSVASKKRSIQAFNEHLPDYICGPKKNPPPLSLPQMNDTHEKLFEKAKLNNFLWVMARLNSEEVNSWTGFNICIRRDLQFRADSVGYLPTINSPATKMSSVQEILRNALAIRKTLDSEHIVVVMDQALYSKACEITWSHPLYNSVILMMGNFHTICNLLSIIGKFFGDAGLRDLAVESGTIAEGSISKVLEGRQYNRGVRMHKLIYEAVMRVVWKSFLEWLQTHDEAFYSEVELNMRTYSESISKNLDPNTYKDVSESPFVTKIFSCYEIFIKFLRKENGPLSTYWSHYIELVEILLGLLRANREGDWNLYLYCLEKMLPWCFTMDKINYARYLSFHYMQIANLRNIDETYYQYFLNGGFSVQMSNTNPFGRIPIDQVIEETVNRDTQTARGTRNYSLRLGAVSRYYLTAEFRAIALKELRNVTCASKESLQHPDLSSSRRRKDNKNVESLVELFNGWTNPFELNAMDIVNLSNGVSTPKEVSESLLKAKERGEEACAKFRKSLESGVDFYTPIKKLKVRTFSDIKKVNPKMKRERMQLESDRQLFAKILLIAESRKVNMKDLFSYPLGSVPCTLANLDGTMKKTSKAALSLYLEKKISVSECFPSPAACVVDGMSAIQKLCAENLTFKELATSFLKKILLQYNNYARIDVVFDVYCANSIKQLERKQRGENESITFHEIKSGHKIVNWRRILKNSDAKNKLTKYIVDRWKEERNLIYLQASQTLYVTNGKECIKLTSGGVESVPELNSNQEEADTRMMLHIQDASKSFKNILCVSDDTDVMVLCMYVNATPHFTSKIFLKRSPSKVIEIPKLISVVGKKMATALVGLHAYTGCDTVSAFSGKGKVTPFNLVFGNEQFISLFSKIGVDVNISNDLFKGLQEFTCQLYSRGTNVAEVNTLRYNLFRSKRGKIDSSQLPPCENVLHLHAKRANYQAFLWRQCLVPILQEVSLEDHGWTTDAEGNISTVWTTVKTAPEAVLNEMSCKCKRKCIVGYCECLAHHMKCSAVCHSFSCDNEPEESSEEDNFPVECLDSSSDDSDDDL